MRNHGPIVIGPTIAAAFDRLYYLEEVCKRQMLAMAAQRPLQQVSAPIVAQLAEDIPLYDAYAQKHLAAIRRVWIAKSRSTPIESLSAHGPAQWAARAARSLSSNPPSAMRLREWGIPFTSQCIKPSASAAGKCKPTVHVPATDGLYHPS